MAYGHLLKSDLLSLLADREAEIANLKNEVDEIELRLRFRTEMTDALISLYEAARHVTDSTSVLETATKKRRDAIYAVIDTMITR